jgi:hypothetical protein
LEANSWYHLIVGAGRRTFVLGPMCPAFFGVFGGMSLSEMNHKMQKVLHYSLAMLAILAILGGSSMAARRTVLLEQVTNAGCG